MSNIYSNKKSSIQKEGGSISKAMLKPLLLLFALFSFSTGYSQDTLHQESFESDGEGTRYTTNGSFYANGDDYWQRVENLGAGTYNPSLNTTTWDYENDQDGSFFWAGEDVDASGGNDSAYVMMDSIDITGYTGLTLKMMAASGTDVDIDDNDFVDIWVRVDNGVWTRIASFRNDGTAFNTQLLEDTDLDEIGDGTPLDSTFKEFAWNVGNTGTYLDVKVEARLDAGDEEFAFDNVLVEGNCAAPTALNATNITSTSADLAWTSNGQAEWNIEWGGSGFAQGSGTMVNTTTNPHNLSGLSSNTAYDFYVQGICSMDSSAWAGPYTFTTPCATQVAPYSQDFENGGNIPTCWENAAGNSENWLFGTSPTYGPSADHTTGSGYFAYVDDSSPHGSDTLYSPSVDVSGLAKPWLRFFLYSDNQGNTSVDFSVDVWDGSAWNNDLLTSNSNTAGWEEMNVDLSALTISGDVKVRFVVEENNSTDFYDDLAIDDVFFEEGPSCPDPTNLTASNLYSDSAEISWTSMASGTDWKIEYDTAGFTQGAGTIDTVSSTTTTITGLSPETDYEFYVMELCSGTDSSNWVGPLSFTTPCAAVVAPYTEDFENGGIIPDCWMNAPNNTDGWEFGTSVAHGPSADNTTGSGYFAYIDDSSPHGEDTLYSAKVDVSGLAKPWLRFFLFSDNEGNTNVDFSVDVWDGSSWNNDILTSSINTAGWEEKVINLDNLTISGNVQVRFVVEENNGTDFYDDLAIDDVIFEEGPACADPTNLSLTFLKHDSAGITWTSVEGGNTWQIEWDTAGFTPGTGNLVLTNNNPDTLTGLTKLTNYEFYVREVCSASDSSNWVGPFAFTTPPSCPVPSNLGASVNSPTSADVSWTSNAPGSSWQIEYDSSGFTPGTGNTVLTSNNPHTLSGLTQNTDYDFYVREICGAGDTSAWAGPNTFTTPCGVQIAPYLQTIDNNFTPDCWSVNTANGDGWDYGQMGDPDYGASSTAEHTGNGGYFAWVDFSSSEDTTALVSPEIDVSGLTTPQLVYWFFSDNTDVPGDNNTLSVQAWDGATWVTLRDIQQDSSTWVRDTFDISAYIYSGNLVRVRFVAQENQAITAYENDILLDDIEVREQPTCFDPSNLSANPISGDSVIVDWTPSTASQWQVEYGPLGFSPGSGTRITTNNVPDTLTGLMPQTDYTFYVREICGPSDTSGWVSSGFTTPCGTKTAPYLHTYDNSSFNICWPDTALAGTSSWELGQQGSADYGASNIPEHTGNGGYYAWVDFSSVDTAALYSPEIDVSGLTNPQLKFYFFSNNTNNPGDNNNISVQAWNGSSWIQIKTMQGDDPDWVRDTTGLGIHTYGSGLVRIRFVAQANTNITEYYNDLLIDDFEVRERPSCYDPTNITANSSIYDSATISWNSGGAGSTWQIEYDTAGFTPGTGDTVTVSSNPYTLGGLLAETDYDFYVREICGAGDTSIWIGPASTTTPPSCPVPSNLNAANLMPDSAQLSWTSNALGGTWQIEYGFDGFAQGAGDTVTTTSNPYTLTGLQADTTYDFYVREICGAGDSSVWSGPYSFTTPCTPFMAPYLQTYDNNFDPACWISQTPNGSGWEYGQAGDAGYGAGSAADHTGNGGYFTWVDFSGGSDTAIFTSPLIDVNALAQPALEFFFFSDNTNNPGDNNILTVEVHDGTGWQNLTDLQLDNGGWTKYLFDLTPYVSSNDLVRVRFIAKEDQDMSTSAFYNDLLLDDFHVKEMPVCPDPHTLSATGISNSEGEVSWVSPGGGPNWEIEYDTIGFTQGTGNTVVTNDNPDTLSGLTPATGYDVYVRELCGGGDTSAWIGPVTFYTECPTYTATYTENFDGVATPNIPTCWTIMESNPGEVESVTSTDQGFAPTSPPNAIELNDGDITSGDTAVIVSPQFTDLGTGNNWIRFQAKLESTGDTSQIIVGTIKNPNLPSTFSPYDTIKNLPLNSWQEFFVPMDNVAAIGADEYIGLMHGSGTYEIYIDDFIYEPIPSCPQPTSLSASNVKHDSVDLDWTSNGGGNTWIVEYDTAGFTPGTGNTTVVSNHPISIGGLTSETDYDFYLREVCAPGDTSVYGGPISITTPCTPPVISSFPYTENFDGVTAPALPCGWSNANYNNDGDEWITSTDDPFSGPNSMYINYDCGGPMDDWFFTPEIQLTAGQTYEVSFVYKAYSASYPENMAVHFGSSPDSSMSNQIWSHVGFAHTTYTDTSIQFTPSTSGSYYIGFEGFSASCQWDIYVDDFELKEILADDIAVVSVDTPATDACDFSASETIAVTIENYGLNAQSGFDVSYRVNGGTVVTETVSATVASGSTYQYSFTQGADLSTDGVYTLEGFTELAADQAVNNDTNSTDIENLGSTGLNNATSVMNMPIVDMTKSNLTFCGLPSNLNGCFVVKSVTIDSMFHEYPSDMDLYLVSPAGDTLALSQGNGGFSDDTIYDVTFNNQASTTVGGTYTDGGTFLPDDTTDLGIFNGSNPNGAWQLLIDDTYPSLDDGNLYQWSMEFGYADLPVDLGNDTIICDADSSVTLDAGDFNTYYWSTTGSTDSTITVDTAGSYVVNVTDVYGCTGSDTITVSTTIHPDSVDLGNDTTICENTSVILDPGSDYQVYTWTTGETTQAISVDTAGQYVVEVANTDGCNGPGFDTINVSLAPAPVTDLGNDTTICTGNTLTLDAGTFSGYLWNDSTTNQTLTVDTTGTYWVRMTGSNGCYGYDSIYVNVAPQANTLDLGKDTSICSTDTLMLDAGSGFDDYSWNTGDTTQMIQADTSGQYIATVTNSMGCLGSDSDTINVTVKPAPIVDLGNDTTFCADDTLVLNAGSGFASYVWSDSSNADTLAVSTTGTYWVEVTNSAGCSNGDTISVNTMANPANVSLGADDTICPGDTATLNAGAGYQNYLWNTGETTQMINADTSGQYTVEVSNVTGCVGTGNDTVNLQVNPAPMVDLGIDTTICADQALTIDAGANWSSYNWNTGATTQTITVDTTSAGGTGTYNYSVEVSDSVGCTGNDTIAVTFTICIGIGEDEQTTFSLFPNPADEQLTFTINGDEVKDYSIELMNMQGKAVFNDEINFKGGQYRNKIDVSDLSRGAYFLKINNGDEVKLERVIIQ